MSEIATMVRPGSPHAVTGRQRAAILMVALGPELAAHVYRHLKEDEIERLTLQVANLRRVPPEVTGRVIEEVEQMLTATEFLQAGGIDYARDVLTKALGPQKAQEVIARLQATLQVRPFEFARQSEPAQLLNFLHQEHPQTIALVLAYLHPEQASTILAALDPARQVDVARRLAVMDHTSPEVVREVEQVLESKFATLATEGTARAGGIEAAVAVLNRADRATEKRILETLESEDPELAAEIKKRMFVFEDLVLLDDRSLQRALRQIDLSADMPLALKVVSEEVKSKIFRNISQRAGEMLRESLDYLGPVRLRDVEEAQQRIVNVIRRLEDEGEIVISRGGGDELVV
jgi:flagellar motor switch protein FliG